MRSRLRSDAHGPKDRRPTAQTWGLAGLEGDSPPGERDPDEQESGVVEGNCTRTPGHSLSRVGVETEDSYLCYDFNDDGIITTADARVLLQFVAGKLLIDEQNAHYAYLDVNDDGSINAADAQVITEFCAELEVAVDLTAKSTTPTNQVTVPAGETLKLTGQIVLTDTDRLTATSSPTASSSRATCTPPRWVWIPRTPSPSA